jgi:hypothetical protein
MHLDPASEKSGVTGHTPSSFEVGNLRGNGTEVLAAENKNR